MTITSKDVSKSIGALLKDRLRAEGFSEHTSRSFWRHHDHRIDVINFQSFNEYLAKGLGCTTYSFSLIIGCDLLCIPDCTEIPVKDGLRRPEPYACDFYCTLKRGYFQKKPLRRDIWFIKADGENVERAVRDAGKQLEHRGFSWFERFNDLPALLKLLQRKRYATDTWGGIGNNPSPIRHYLTAYLAKALGEVELAEKSFEAVRETPGYSELFPALAQPDK